MRVDKPVVFIVVMLAFFVGAAIEAINDWENLRRGVDVMLPGLFKR